MHSSGFKIFKDLFSKYLIIPFVFLVSAFAVYYPVTDGDIFWHLSAGREMVQTNSFLFSDPFAYTSSGVTWINIHWLFQLIIYGVYTVSGYQGIILFNCCVFGLTVIILYMIHKLSAVQNILMTILIFFAVFHIQYLIPLRPGTITLLMIALFIFICEQFRQNGRNKGLLLLPVIQIVWVNIQGLFLIGPLIVSIYCIGTSAHYFLSGRDKNYTFKKQSANYGVIALLTFIASIVNPNGVNVVTFALRLLIRIIPYDGNIASYTIDENNPLWYLLSQGKSDYAWIMGFFCFLTILMFVATRKKPDYVHSILFIVFFLLAVCAERNIPMFFCIVIPVISKLLHRIKFTNILYVPFLVISLCVLTIKTIVVADATFKFKRMTFNGTALSPFCFPLNSSVYLSKIRSDGKLFNADRYGGYIIWKHYPEHKVYIDTRLTMRNNKFFEDYLSILDYPEQIDNVIRKYDIDKIILPFAPYPRYWKLVCYLKNCPEWVVLFSDGIEIFFVKKQVAQTINYSQKFIKDTFLSNAYEYPDQFIDEEKKHYIELSGTLCR